MDNAPNFGTDNHNPGTAATTVLLADVGGTNTRLAVARDGALMRSAHFENANFASFYDLVAAFVKAEGVGAIEACSVAMAGPVRGEEGQLTNLDWNISTSELRRILPCEHAVLLNDLSALGHALGALERDNLAAIDLPETTVKNGQAIVIGIGTGFNFAPVQMRAGGGLSCLEVEMGHAAFPAPLRDRLEHLIGDKISEVRTLENLFSGSGLARFHQIRTGDALSARGVVKAYQSGDSAARETLDHFTTLLGQLCRELVYQYMPLDGIYFAGSVARGVLMPEFHANLHGDPGGGDKFGDLQAGIPKWTILDDAAALRGCLAALNTR